MKYLLTGLAGLLVVVLPFTALAAEFKVGEDQIRITDEVIDDNLYVAAGNVVVESDVRGDAFISGGQIDVEGTVEDDLFIGGGNIRVMGDVQGDVRIGGGNVRIEGNVGGELMVGGGTVEIGPDAVVTGESFIGTGQLTVEGATAGIMAQAGDVQIRSTARINGDLDYVSPEQATVEDGAVISGTTNHKLPPDTNAEVAAIPLLGIFAGAGFFWLLTSLLMLLLFVYLLPNKAQVLATSWKESFGMNLLIGFIFLVVTPIAAIALMISIIGIPLGIGTLLLYPVILYIGKLAGTIAAGAWIRSLLDKDAGMKLDWMSVLLGFIVVTLIGFVPGIGALITCVVMLAGLGAVVRYDWSLVQTLRTRKEL